MDYYFLPPGTGDIAKGGTLRFDLAVAGPIALAQRAAQRAGNWPLWGAPLKRALQDCCNGVDEIEVEVFHDFLPSDQTFVDLDPNVKDRWRLPAARIHVAESSHQQKAGKWLADRGSDVLAAIGAHSIQQTTIGSINRNLICGTCRAGLDPSQSVVNGFCQSHEVPNLFVIDGSFMPSGGGVPPTLTILANSLRVADFIVDGAKKGAFRAGL